MSTLSFEADNRSSLKVSSEAVCLCSVAHECRNSRASLPQDDENKFDMLVRNCVAHDGKRAPIQLVDELGCVTRPKIMSRFQKIKNFGSSASVVSYAYFQAFKFPDSMNVHFQCVIQVGGRLYCACAAYSIVL
jgi:hypothetical protein